MLTCIDINLIFTSFVLIIMNIDKFDNNRNQMIRKVHTRAGHRQNYYHETNPQNKLSSGNSVIRPPTSHPYSGYKHNKSQSQLRAKYSPTYFFDNNKLECQKQKQNKMKVGSIQKSSLQLQLNADRLPTIIKHTINQIKIILKNSQQAYQNTEFQNVIQILIKSIKNVVAGKQKAQQQKLECMHKIENLEECITRMQKTNKKQTQELEYQKKYLQKKFGPNFEQQIILENCRLGEMNMRYQARIAELQNKTQKISEVFNEDKDPSNKLDTQLLRCHNRISYLQIKLGNAQKNEGQLLAKIQEYEKSILELRSDYSKLEDRYSQVKDKMFQWRERAMMQKEDGQIQISRQQFLLYSLRKLRENNKGLLNKLLSKNSSSEQIQKKYLMQNPNFQYESDFFKSLKTSYEKGNCERLYSNDQIKKNELGVEIEENLFDVDYRNYKKDQPFDVNSLKLFRPSFFAFLEESCNSDIVNCRSNESTSVSRVFIQVLRAVMNSKLNQFLYIDSPEKFSRFPEFVYAWFQKFYFNSQKKCVMMLQPFMQKPFSQQMFYRDLMNVRLDQSWEIITFREFLLEELSLQQLYFFLICQNLLYTRAGITKQMQYYGDFNILVDYASAKSVLDLALNDFQSWNITFLTSKLRQKLIIKNSSQMVEAGFFLRCLVEYYRIQRNNRYRYISRLSKQFKDAKKGLRFSSFMSIINKFTELPMQSKLKLYRDCFCLSKGVITPESIFIICSESLVFCKYLKMKSFYRLPKILNRSMKMYHNLQVPTEKSPIMPEKLCINPASPYLQSILLEFKKVIEQQNSLMHRAESLGVHELNSQIIYMIKALDERNTEINSNILKCKHFIHYFYEMMEKIRKITFMNFYELLEQQWKKKNKHFWVELPEQDLGGLFAAQIKSSFETYHKINNLRIWKNKIYNFRVHYAAKKIQKQVKKKFIEPYKQIYDFFSNEGKTVEDQDGNKQQNPDNHMPQTHNN